MTRILVTGAHGFIGRQVLPLLTRRDYDVHALTTGPGAGTADEGVTWHQADLLRHGSAAGLLDAVRPDRLLHLAWYAVPGNFWTSTENVRWVEASLRLLHQFAVCGGTRAVVAGSCAEYDVSYGFCSEGLTPTVPATLYGACKLAVQQVAAKMSPLLDISVVWPRIFFVYGPHDRSGRLVPSVIRHLLNNQEAACTHGSQIRDYLHSSDVAAALVELMDSAPDGPINVASGNPISLQNVVRQIAQIIGTPGLVTFGAVPAPEDDQPMIVADTRRLREMVGWSPQMTLEEGLSHTVAWWRDTA